MPKITTCNLTKYFVDKKKKTATAVLYNVGCEIPDKSFTVIIGKSGSGKSTFIKTLAGLISPDEGQILFDGVDVTYVTAAQRNVSLLTQEYALYPHLTVFDNIAYPLKLMRAPAEEIRSRVNEICELLDISLLSSRRIRQLSGGQLQRVALARALVKNPDVVLLDEPLSNLDEKSRADISLQFKKLQKKLSCSFIYVTHSIAEAQRLADYIVVFDNGDVIQQGEAQKIIRDTTGAFFEFAQSEANAMAKEMNTIGDNADDEIL